MSDVDWRVWVYNTLVGFNGLTSIVPAESVYGAGSLTGAPEDKPFIVISLGDEYYAVPGTCRTDLTLYFHDEPGNFNTIRDAQKQARNALCGVNNREGQILGVKGAIACRWDSNSPDMSDQGYGTLMRQSHYQLVGRDGNA